MYTQKQYNEEYRRKNPWIKNLAGLRKRCNNKNYEKYHRYGGRGIKALLTLEEIKILWFRDKAYLLNRPSVDRVNNDGNYEFNNCRFLEFSENSKRANIKNKTCKVCGGKRNMKSSRQYCKKDESIYHRDKMRESRNRV